MLCMQLLQNSLDSINNTQLDKDMHVNILLKRDNNSLLDIRPFCQMLCLSYNNNLQCMQCTQKDLLNLYYQYKYLQCMDFDPETQFLQYNMILCYKHVLFQMFDLIDNKHSPVDKVYKHPT